MNPSGSYPNTPAPQYNAAYEKPPQGQPGFPQQTHVGSPPPQQMGVPPSHQGSPPPMMHQGSYGMPQQPMGSPGPKPMMQPQMQHVGSNMSQPGMQQPQAAPMAAPGQRQYMNATPLTVLNRGAAPVDCPACGHRGLTRTTFETGNTTHVWALVCCCLTLVLTPLPYLMNSTKDVAHHCGHCGVLLATYHKSGTTEVHQHS
ncbi:MAG: hypothetical protein M1824_000562 [Vezdaea acicularis]|nr:MAG: hypothetical protein M1824_000562 [Vezdaea acicularis]